MPLITLITYKKKTRHFKWFKIYNFIDLTELSKHKNLLDSAVVFKIGMSLKWRHKGTNKYRREQKENGKILDFICILYVNKQISFGYEKKKYCPVLSWFNNNLKSKATDHKLSELKNNIDYWEIKTILELKLKRLYSTDGGALELSKASQYITICYMFAAAENWVHISL